VKLVSYRKERKVEDVWKQGAEITEADKTGNAEREKSFNEEPRDFCSLSDVRMMKSVRMSWAGGIRPLRC
jgi:hypothetical protein